MYKVESRTTKASPKIACDAMVCLFKATEEPAGLLGPARDGGCKTQKLANYLQLTQATVGAGTRSVGPGPLSGGVLI